MSYDLALVLALLASAIVMFTVNKPRMDVVAILMMVLLPLTGIITVEQALAGLSDPNIVLIAALFVIGEGLVRTGVAQRLGDMLVRRAGASEAKLIVLLMIIVAGIGSVMSSTGVVAIFIPIVLRIARNTATAPGRLMMPLSMAALISGMMTLVATAPNLVVHSELIRHGHTGFDFFSFTPFGLPLLGLAILYMLFARRFLGRDEAGAQEDPARPDFAQWIGEYALAGREHRLRVPSTSPLVGKTLETLDLRGTSGANIIAIERARRLERDLILPRAQTVLEAGDVLFLDLFSPDTPIEDLTTRYGLAKLPLAGEYFSDHTQEIGMAEAMIPATSPLVGKTLAKAQFRSKYDLVVIGVKRGSYPQEGDIPNLPLKTGDTLLLTGPWRAIRKLAGAHNDLIMLHLPAEADDVIPAASRAPFAIATLALMVILMVWGIVPNVQAALICCLLMGLFGCVDMNAAYRSIHWPSLLLIVGMLPFSIALQVTGGVDLAAEAMLNIVGTASPRMTLAVLFTVTAILGLFISNTATAVLMAPVALAIAAELGASPYPFAMTVALAASAAFMTPVSSPVNTLVVGPGNYTFFDFIRIGVPFTLVALLVSALLVPIVMPLY